MDEPEVKTRLEAWLNKQGYRKVEKNGSPKDRRFGNIYITEPPTDDEDAVRLDYYVYTDVTIPPMPIRKVLNWVEPHRISSNQILPSIVWVEAKGDQNLSGLLEGFIRLEYGIFYNGGQGLFACPTEATEMMLEIREFLSKAVSGRISIFDAEKEEIHHLSNVTIPLESHRFVSR